MINFINNLIIMINFEESTLMTIILDNFGLGLNVILKMAQNEPFTSQTIYSTAIDRFVSLIC